jgi:hydrogenase expression/formation protein HypE
MNNKNSLENFTCPLPYQNQERIVLGHGSGGQMTHNLIKNLFLPTINNRFLMEGNDAAKFSCNPGFAYVVSTDAHVVSPLFFRGGDIGRLAVCGSINDVSMLGAQPLYLTASFILEEGLEISILKKIIESMSLATVEAECQIIAGDTKVVQKGKADGIFISTTGIGIVDEKVNIGGANAQTGDVIILSGSIGEHGIAVLEARGDLGINTSIVSDVAPLNHLVKAMMNTSDGIHVMRDPTRGGLGTTLNEIASQSNKCMMINEESIQIFPSVIAACELLGFDPLYLANEGKLIALVAEKEAEKVLEIMHKTRFGENATIIGRVINSPENMVLMRTVIGTTRVIDMLSGEMLPRIC